MEKKFVDLLVEVKCSRRERFAIKERDIRGLRPGHTSTVGLLATLITSSLSDGPHWIFVPAQKISQRSYTLKSLRPLKVDFDFLKALDYLWGDVLLNDELMDKLLSMKKMDFKSMKWWQNLPYKPLTIEKNAIRNIKVHDALHALRSRLDSEYGRSGARREGFLHQCIIQFCLNKSGYETISNIIGVPDLQTQITHTELT